MEGDTSRDKSERAFPTEEPKRKKPGPKSMDEKTRKWLETRQKELEVAIKADSHNRKEAAIDLEFSIGNNQWDEKALRQREVDGRPSLTINMLNPFIKKIVGDQRQTRPRIKIRANDINSDANIASIRQGIIWNIENDSYADSIYDHAFEMCVRCGYGAWRILTRYGADNPFQQEAYLERIPNPLLVYFDPNCKDFMHSDARYCFILSKMGYDEAKRLYPDLEKLDTIKKQAAVGITAEHWWDKDTITLAEYITREKYQVNMCLLSDGRVLDEDEAQQIVEEEQARYDETILQINMIRAVNPAAPIPDPAEPVRIEQTKKADRYRIKQYIMTATQLLNEHGLEGEPFPGSIIPVVLMRGEECNVKGKTYIRSMIRFARDPQKLYNYWKSTIAERLALIPKAPWIGTPKMFEGYESDYENANTQNIAMLYYNPDPQAPPGAKPERLQDGNVSPSVFAEVESSKQDLRDVIGMHASDMGSDNAPEQSGVAIAARQRPGNAEAFVFLDNWARAICHSGRILNDIISSIYDAETEVRIRKMDNTESIVPINTSVTKAKELVKRNPERYNGIIEALKTTKDNSALFNSIKQGKYNVTVDMGPTYATQRQEAANTLLALVQTMPSLQTVAADLVAASLDIQGADELRDRLRKMLPPGLIPPKEGESPQQLPPTPQQQAAMLEIQTKQTNARAAEIKAQAALVKSETEKLKALTEMQSLGAIETQGREMVRNEILNTLAELEATEPTAAQGQPGQPEQPGLQPQAQQPMQPMQ